MEYALMSVVEIFDSNWGGMGTSQSGWPIEPLGVAWGQ